MKKQILMLAAVGVAVCALGGCKSKSTNEYDALNAMLDVSYSKIELTVTDTFDANTSLKSEYTITYSDTAITVEYTVERFAEISLDSPQANVKTTLIGEAVIKGGEISIDGDDVGLTADIAKVGLTFQKGYFKNAQLTGIYLKADVKDPSAFLGSQLVCTEMRVEATFLEMFFDINITYTSEIGSRVEYQYIFTP